ncbi:MAG: GAF domain-containing protein [Actinomycetes bacterium]
MTLTSELSLDALLTRLVEAAASLTGARYAALGVIDPAGNGLEQFHTHGVPPETETAIGHRPAGLGILGALMRETHALRLHDLANDPRSVGFPPNHPPMRTFLGVPILLRGVNYGSLYLTEKHGGHDFTEEDEELATLLAAQAAVAIENVRLFESATRWSSRLESLIEVGNALATETDIDALLDLVARRLRELLDASFVTVVLPSGDDELRFAAVAGKRGDELLGSTIRRSASKSGRILKERRSERVNSMVDDPDVDQRATRMIAVRSGLFVPMIVRNRAIGVLAAHDKLGPGDGTFSDDDQRLTEAFASRAAVAVDISERVARDSLRRVVAAQELERRRLARELHDETGQSLTSILLGLRALEDTSDPARTKQAVANLREMTVATLQDVRRLAVELRPKALDDFGLIPALERLTETWHAKTGITVDFAARLGDDALATEVATALYRIVQEALTNIVKHAQAGRVSILLTRKNGGVVAVIEDDGRGFEPGSTTDGFGIQGMRERVELLDGRFGLESRAGAGTTIIVEVPVA